MESLETEVEAADFPQQFRNGLGIDAELFRSASHLHSRGLELEVGIDANRNARRPARGARKLREQGDFAWRFDVDQDSRRHGLRELVLALARAGEADLGGIHGCVERNLELTARRHVQTVDQSGHVADERRHRVCLHRVVKPNGGRHVTAQLSDARRQQSPIVGVKRRAAHLHSESGERHAADDQAVVRHRPLRHWRMARHAQDCVPAKRFENSAPSILRSILPLALRGSGPTRTSILFGTM